ncbi:MAG: disulfide bond formation protein B [Hyphomicrobiales bacterium]
MKLTDSAGRAQIVFGGLALLLALGAIGSAWGFQLIGGYVPCALCLEQREPYYLGIPILLLAVILTIAKPHLWLVRLLYVAFAIVIAYGFYLAVYHAGAEWELWLGPSDCGGTPAVLTDTTDLLAQLETVKIISCTEAAARFLGLSFAGWNAVATLVLAVLGLLAAFSSANKEA